MYPKLVLNTLMVIKSYIYIYTLRTYVATSLLEECEDDIHTLEMGTWESFGTPKTLEFDCRGQNTLA